MWSQTEDAAAQGGSGFPSPTAESVLVHGEGICQCGTLAKCRPCHGLFPCCQPQHVRKGKSITFSKTVSSKGAHYQVPYMGIIPMSLISLCTGSYI